MEPDKRVTRSSKETTNISFKHPRVKVSSESQKSSSSKYAPQPVTMERPPSSEASPPDNIAEEIDGMKKRFSGDELHQALDHLKKRFVESETLYTQEKAAWNEILAELEEKEPTPAQEEGNEDLKNKITDLELSNKTLSEENKALKKKLAESAPKPVQPLEIEPQAHSSKSSESQGAELKPGHYMFEGEKLKIRFPVLIDGLPFNADERKILTQEEKDAIDDMGVSMHYGSVKVFKAMNNKLLGLYKIKIAENLRKCQVCSHLGIAKHCYTAKPSGMAPDKFGTFTCESHLNRHYMNYHHAIVTCDICGAIFDRQRLLGSHKKVMKECPKGAAHKEDNKKRRVTVPEDKQQQKKKRNAVPIPLPNSDNSEDGGPNEKQHKK